MKNILTRWKNQGLSFNSVLPTRAYSHFVSKNSNFTGLDPNWVTGLVDAEGTFIIFIKLNSNNPQRPLCVLGSCASNKKIRQIQLSFEVCVHIKDIDLLYKLKSFFGEAGSISIPSTRKDARLKITRLVLRRDI